MTMSFRLILIVVSSVLWFPPGPHGQIQPSPASPGRSRPLKVPISGAVPAGGVVTDQTTAPGGGPGTVDALTSSVRIQGPFQGSTPVGTATTEPLPLPLAEAVQRGLKFNLGVIGATQLERDAFAQRRGARALLLPDVNGTATAAIEQVSLATVGLQSVQGIPGFQFARVLGPFNFYEAGVAVSQRVLDLTAVRNYRSSKALADATTLD